MIISDDFLKEIRVLAKQDGITHMEATIEVCERHDIEIEVAASIIKNNPKLKALIQIDAENLNFMPKTKRLPKRRA